MARREIIVDDLDEKESPDVAERRFSVGTTDYTIDLSDKNWKKLEDALSPFVAKATEVKGPRVTVTSTGGGKKPRDYDLNAFREWARGQGHQVADKGRPNLKLLDEFKTTKEHEKSKPA